MMEHAHKNILVALAGQPNSGKSTLFTMLTGAAQHIANFPGVTVEKKQGTLEIDGYRIELVDLPGTYSLTSFTQEERIARDFILLESPEAVIAVTDASNLERHLPFVFQLLEMEVPLILCLNMLDVAQRRGYVIDTAALSQTLGVPVVGTIAPSGKGRDALLRAIRETVGDFAHKASAWRMEYGESLEPLLADIEAMLAGREHLMEDFSARWLAVKLLEGDGEARRIVQHHTHDGQSIELLKNLDKRIRDGGGTSGEDVRQDIARARHDEAKRIAGLCLTRTGDSEKTFSDQLDAVACHPWLGIPLAGLVLYAIFRLTFELSDGWRWIPWLDGWQTPTGVMGWLFSDLLPGLLTGMNDGPLRSMLADGVVAGVGGVMGFVPFIFFMFVFLGMIEDSGYVARIAFVLDRFLRGFGLPGNSVLPLILSGGITGGCAVPGLLATRALRDDRDRLTTMLVAPFMNCGAKIPVYVMLIAAFFPGRRATMMWLLTGLAWGVALIAAYILRRTVIRGEQAPFILEIPSYHVPAWRVVFRGAWTRSWMFLRKAGTIILVVNVGMWGLMYLPRASTNRFDEKRDALRQELTARGGIEAIPESATDFAAWLQDDSHFDESARQWIDGYRARWLDLQSQEDAWQLRQSFAGRLGRLLEPLSRFAGFDWRDNVALVGGVAAKEVVVSTLGTAYSLGGAPRESEEVFGNPLAERLRRESGWTPLRAFSMMIFVMLYCPCLPTVSVIWRESRSWRWALFSMTYSTGVAFLVAMLVYQTGRAFGIGT